MFVLFVSALCLQQTCKRESYRRHPLLPTRSDLVQELVLGVRCLYRLPVSCKLLRYNSIHHKQPPGEVTVFFIRGACALPALGHQKSTKILPPTVPVRPFARAACSVSSAGRQPESARGKSARTR